MSWEGTPRSAHESFDARPGNQAELSNWAGVKLLNIIGSTSLFSLTTSFSCLTRLKLITC